MNQYKWYGGRIDDIFVFGLGAIVTSFSHFYFSSVRSAGQTAGRV
jgi:hypothetical protein